MAENKIVDLVEQLEVQLAGCATAALGWNSEPAKEGDYGWSPAYQDVLNLRRKFDAVEPGKLLLIRRQIDLLTNSSNHNGSHRDRIATAEPALAAVQELLNAIGYVEPTE